MSYPLIVIICSSILLIICLGCHCWGFIQGSKASEEISKHALDEVGKAYAEAFDMLKEYIEEYIKRPPT